MPVTTELRPSDVELVAACRAGEPGAWDALVERFARYVSAIATQAFRLPPQDAEDVFQIVFLRVYERLDTLRSDDAIRPWVGQLTRNCCLDVLRSSGRTVPVEEVDAIVERHAEDVIGRLDEAMEVREGARAARPRVSGDPRPLLRSGRELPDDRRRARDPGWHDREPHLSLPRSSPHGTGGESMTEETTTLPRPVDVVIE